MAKPVAPLPAEWQNGLGELWARIRLVFYSDYCIRIGAHIPVPGINPDRLSAFVDQNEGTFLSLFNVFFRGARLNRMSIFALGFWPYISALYYYCSY